MAPLRSPLSRALGLGSAKEGVAQWWTQRVTAVALVPLGLWFCASLVSLAGAGRAVLVEWLHGPVAAILMILTIGAAFYHGALGIQVVIEDYAPNEGAKIVGIVLTKLAAFLLAVAGIFAVLKLAFGG
ncbi:MAG TPA: succinate dehydrogenase, hydrophobic membrane anchor protein [Stellaceae bacterium]|jgi:succinate dehydrogenase / fumarate reductase membrane anchor subunit|nr:succinate dehydrogenase, hydrophobic membrane anchor protein [Stellaceae bacterium]